VATEQHDADRREQACEHHENQCQGGDAARYEQTQGDGSAGHLQHAKRQSNDGPRALGAWTNPAAGAGVWF
jgi:hypothetical protein